MCPDAHGEPTYTEAVAMGLYGDQDPHASADGALTTYSVVGPAIPAKFGRTEGAGAPIRQAERS